MQNLVRQLLSLTLLGAWSASQCCRGVTAFTFPNFEGIFAPPRPVTIRLESCTTWKLSPKHFTLSWENNAVSSSLLNTSLRAEKGHLLSTRERRLRRLDSLHRNSANLIASDDNFNANAKNRHRSSEWFVTKDRSRKDRPDAQQLGSIRTTAPAVLLRSGPGTGKSRVLSARVAYLLKSGQCDPRNMIILSFTNHDARRLKKRSMDMLRDCGYFDADVGTAEKDAENLVGSSIWSGTLHGLSAAILRKNGIPVRVSTDEEKRRRIKRILNGKFSIYSSTSSVSLSRNEGDGDAIISARTRLFRAALKECGGFTDRARGNLVDLLARTIILWKEAGVVPPPFVFLAKLAEDEHRDRGGTEDQRKDRIWSSGNDECTRTTAIDCASKLGLSKTVALLALDIYADYQESSHIEDLVDSADLVPLACEFLRASPRALSSLRGKLRHVVVDEYQDVSVRQRDLLRLLVLGPEGQRVSSQVCEKHPIDAVLSNFPVASSCFGLYRGEDSSFDVPKIFCAGDANQSIYGWRGATPTLTVEGFLRDFPQGVVITLGTSYRLPRKILSAASVLLVGGEENLELTRIRATADEEWSSGPGAQEDGLCPIRSFEVSPAGRRATYMVQDVTAADTSGGLSLESNALQWRGENIRFSHKDMDEKRVIVKGLWDSREEAKWIASSIRKRAKARLRFLASVTSTPFDRSDTSRSGSLKRGRKRGGKRVFKGRLLDWSDVAIIVRLSSQMKPMEDALRIAGIPHITERSSADRASGKQFNRRSIRKKKEEKFDDGLLSMSPVRIITMHMAKGEEFDDIYLAGWEEGVFPHPSSVRSNRIHEERRLAYVALTRSRQRAIITYCSVRKRKRMSAIERVYPSRFLCELVPMDSDCQASFMYWSQSLGIKDIIAGQNLPDHFAKSYKKRNKKVSTLCLTDIFAEHPSDTPSVKDKNTDSHDKTVNKKVETAGDETVLVPGNSSLILEELTTVRSGLCDIMRGRKGACKELKADFRNILRYTFGMKRGRVLVVPKSILLNGRPHLGDIPQSALSSRPISKCTALELGIYLEHILLERIRQQKGP